MIPGCIENGAPTNYSYDLNHKHAVASAGGATYQYDANGNMTNRNGDALTYDAENRLVSVVKGGVTTSFAYNGDGTRVKRSASNAGTMYYIGNYFEVWVPNSGTTTFNKYYYFSAQRIAARIASTLFYFQGDHLGSSSIAMTQAGTSFYSRQMYYPYGAPRTTEGSALPTDNTFTGQKSDDSTGLMFYGARYYDTSLGRFTQPDTIVPNPLNPQSLNRFAYVLNNPLKYTDPTGHVECWDEDCNGGPSGGGGSGGGGSGGTPNPCNADPTAEGCPGAQEPVLPVVSPTNPNPECVSNCTQKDDQVQQPTPTSPIAPEEAQGASETIPQPKYSFGTGRQPVCLAGGCVNWNLSFWAGNPASPLTVSSVGWLNATSGCGLAIGAASVSCNPGGNASIGSTEFGIPGGKTKLSYYAGFDHGPNGINTNAGVTEAIVFPGLGVSGFGITQNIRVSKSISNEDIAGGAALATLPIYFASRGLSLGGGLNPRPAPAGIIPLFIPNQNEWY